MMRLSVSFSETVNPVVLRNLRTKSKPQPGEAYRHCQVWSPFGNYDPEKDLTI
jgi:hypothetical protein